MKKQILIKRKQSVKPRFSIYYLIFLLITRALLIAVSIYCYLIKYQGKHLLPFQNTNNNINC